MDAPERLTKDIVEAMHINLVKKMVKNDKLDMHKLMCEELMDSDSIIEYGQILLKYEAMLDTELAQV